MVLEDAPSFNGGPTGEASVYMAEVRVRLVDGGASVGKEVEEEGATTYDC